jgi:integrase/recombinase XerD
MTATNARTIYRSFATGRSATTHQLRLKEVRAFWKWMVGEGWTRANPWDRVEGEGRRRSGKPQLSTDEARRFVEACTTDGGEGATAALCSLLLAMRASEIVSLRVRDLDDGGRLVRIEQGKTDAAARVLEVPDVLRPHLLQQAGRRPGAAWLFPAFDDETQHHTRWWLWKHVKRLADTAGARHVSPHGLRGTHATLARLAGATGHLVAAQLGHTSETMTARHYTDTAKVDASERRKTIRVLTGGKK